MAAKITTATPIAATSSILRLLVLRSDVIRQRQTLVSSIATSGTAFSLDFGPSPSDFSLDDFLWNGFGPRLHPREQTLQVVSPARLGIKRHQDARLRFQPEPPQRSQDPVFKHRMKRLFHRREFFGQCHDLDYTGEICVQQTDASRSRDGGGIGSTDSQWTLMEADRVIR